MIAETGTVLRILAAAQRSTATPAHHRPSDWLHRGLRYPIGPTAIPRHSAVAAVVFRTSLVLASGRRSTWEIGLLASERPLDCSSGALHSSRRCPIVLLLNG